MSDVTREREKVNLKTIRWVLRIVGAGLLVATGAIHLDLYLTGYRHIPTIGTLFLLQVIAAFVLALLTLLFAQRVVALSGAGFALSTLGGYILSLWVGLFGFKEIRTTAGIVAGIIEVLTFVVLGTYVAHFATARTADPYRMQETTRRALAPLGLVAVVVLVIAIATSSGASGGGGSTAVAGGASSATITIKNFEFMPMALTVSPGATIAVTNVDGVAHTLTAEPGSMPQGTFNSGNINPNKTVDVTAPMKPGIYRYYCDIHNYMTGTLIVK